MERLTPSEKGRERPVNDITKAIPTAFPRCLESVFQVPLGNWTVLRLGEGQCDVTESCVERMRAGEKCEVSLKTWPGGGGLGSLERFSSFA